MNFASDNVWGVSEQILQAVAAANRGAAAAYGGDDLSRSLNAVFSELFERDVVVAPVSTGIACNALCAALYTPPFGAVMCHETSHINTSECGASEFFSGGAKLIALPGRDGKISADILDARAGEFLRDDTHHVQPALVSITQASELGTVYGLDEVAAIAEVARRHNLAVHMDGARFANALASLGASPADATWRAGVDVLSFGCTKNGSLSADAIILFDPDKAQELLFRRKRAGHELSKARFMAAQLLAYVRDGHWLDLARLANSAAQRLATGIGSSNAARLAFAAEANEVFAILDKTACARLRDAGAVFHEWPGQSLRQQLSLGGDEVLVRLVTSFQTDAKSIDEFISALTNC